MTRRSYITGAELDFSTMSLADLRRVSPKQFHEASLTSEEFTQMLTTCDGFWKHSGNMQHPHAQLSNGDCSNGFVNVLMLIKETNLCRALAQALVSMFRSFYDGEVAWVVGSDHAAADLSHAIAEELGARHDFCEKGPGKTQLWNRFEIAEGEPVLQVEELVRSKDTLEAVRTGIVKAHSHPITFVPCVLAAVHRAEVLDVPPRFHGARILHLAPYEIWSGDQSDCRYCKAGSARLLPKKKEHWAQLREQMDRGVSSVAT